MYTPLRHAVTIVLASLATASSGAGQDVSELRDRATEAYGHGEYAACAEAFEKAAKAATGSAGASDYYNATCCLALAGEIDAAFAMLETAIAAGYANYNTLTSDSDLRGLRDDSRWAPLARTIEPPPVTITDDVADSAAGARFVYDDAERFVHAMTLVSAGREVVPTLEAEVFAKASPGLRMFVEKYSLTAEDVANAIEKRPDAYAAVPRTLELLRQKEDDIRAAFARLQELAPGVVIPPTYFLVADYGGIASGSPEGQLITIERRSEESIGRIETLITHELVHFQQLVSAGSDAFYAIFGPEKSLLALTIREGAAEFLADRVTGRMTQEEARVFAREHEADIWRLFQDEMRSPDTAGWLWSTPTRPDWPRDFAYAFGARIVEAYYERAGDRRRAVAEILSVTDYEDFLRASGFGTR